MTWKQRFRRFFRRLRNKRSKKKDGKYLTERKDVERFSGGQDLVSADYSGHRWRVYSRFPREQPQQKVCICQTQLPKPDSGKDVVTALSVNVEQNQKWLKHTDPDARKENPSPEKYHYNCQIQDKAYSGNVHKSEFDQTVSKYFRLENHDEQSEPNVPETSVRTQSTKDSAYGSSETSVRTQSTKDSAYGSSETSVRTQSTKDSAYGSSETSVRAQSTKDSAYGSSETVNSSNQSYKIYRAYKRNSTKHSSKLQNGKQGTASGELTSISRSRPKARTVEAIQAQPSKERTRHISQEILQLENKVNLLEEKVLHIQSTKNTSTIDGTELVNTTGTVATVCQPERHKVIVEIRTFNPASQAYETKTVDVLLKEGSSHKAKVKYTQFDDPVLGSNCPNCNTITNSRAQTPTCPSIQHAEPLGNDIDEFDSRKTEGITFNESYMNGTNVKPVSRIGKQRHKKSKVKRVKVKPGEFANKTECIQYETLEESDDEDFNPTFTKKHRLSDTQMREREKNKQKSVKRLKKGLRYMVEGLSTLNIRGPVPYAMSPYCAVILPPGPQHQQPASMRPNVQNPYPSWNAYAYNAKPSTSYKNSTRGEKLPWH